MWAAAALLAAGAAAGGAWTVGALPGTGPCRGDDLEVRVAAQPEIAPALREVASRFNVETHRVAGRCVRARVTAVAPAAYARDAAARRDVDAWVPESSLWLGVARAADDRVPPAAVPLAATPVVLATTRPVDAEFRAADVTASWKLLLGDEAGGLPLARRTPDPAVGMGGAIGMIALGQVAGPDEATDDGVVRALRKSAPSGRASAAGGSAGTLADLAGDERFDRPLAVTTEQAVIAYNAAHRPNPVVALAPREGTLMLDHPYAVVARDGKRREAAEAFQAALGSRSARDVLQSRGFRRPDGALAEPHADRLGLPERPPKPLRVPTREEIDRALASWRR